MMMRAAVSFAVAMLAAAVHGAAPMDTPVGVSASVVQDVPGYNSWPMIQAIGDRLVCAYSRGSAHTIDEGKRGVYARTSSDGGRTWTPEVCVVNDPALGEVTIGKGLDGDGAMLLCLVRIGRPKRGMRTHRYQVGTYVVGTEVDEWQPIDAHYRIDYDADHQGKRHNPRALLAHQPFLHAAPQYQGHAGQ